MHYTDNLPHWDSVEKTRNAFIELSHDGEIEVHVNPIVTNLRKVQELSRDPLATTMHLRKWLDVRHIVTSHDNHKPQGVVDIPRGDLEEVGGPFFEEIDARSAQMLDRCLVVLEEIRALHEPPGNGIFSRLLHQIEAVLRDTITAEASAVPVIPLRCIMLERQIMIEITKVVLTGGEGEFQEKEALMARVRRELDSIDILLTHFEMRVGIKTGPQPGQLIVATRKQVSEALKHEQDLKRFFADGGREGYLQREIAKFEGFRLRELAYRFSQFFEKLRGGDNVAAMDLSADSKGVEETNASKLAYLHEELEKCRLWLGYESQ